jgi:hypothetical protein
VHRRRHSIAEKFFRSYHAGGLHGKGGHQLSNRNKEVIFDCIRSRTWMRLRSVIFVLQLVSCVKTTDDEVHLLHLFHRLSRRRDERDTPASISHFFTAFFDRIGSFFRSTSTTAIAPRLWVADARLYLHISCYSRCSHFEINRTSLSENTC